VQEQACRRRLSARESAWPGLQLASVRGHGSASPFPVAATTCTRRAIAPHCAPSQCTAPLFSAPLLFPLSSPRTPSQEHRLELGKDLDLGWYVASGVVAFDLQRRSVKWSQVGGCVHGCVCVCACLCVPVHVRVCGKGGRADAAVGAQARALLQGYGAWRLLRGGPMRADSLLLRPRCPLCRSTWTCPPTSPPSRPTPTQVRTAVCLCGSVGVWLCACTCGDVAVRQPCGCAVQTAPARLPADHEQHILKSLHWWPPACPAAPTLADIDNDGKLEVMLGTSMVSRVEGRCWLGCWSAGWAALLAGLLLAGQPLAGLGCRWLGCR
jgi:hypothetical protein